VWRSTGRLRARQRHRLRGRAAAIVTPALGVKPCLRLQRPGIEEVAKAFDEPLVRASAIAGRDRSKADEFGELAGGLERGSAARADIVDAIGSTAGVVEARLAGHALEMGHQDPLSLGVIDRDYI
jgi:hypothetical protein